MATGSSDFVFDRRITSDFGRVIGALFMTPRLRDEDRLAVDLLLDRAVASSAGNGNGNGHSGFTPVNGAVSEQVAKVQAVLRVLDMMPAEEPPTDLLARTMRRVEAESAAHDPSMLRPPQHLGAGMQMPHA